MRNFLMGKPTLLQPLRLLLAAMVARASEPPALETLRDRSCLHTVVSTPFSSRKDATMMGEKTPIGLGILPWSASRLETWILRIVIEEVLGYNTVFSAFPPGSNEAFYAVAGCHDPFSNRYGQCHHAGPVRTHIIIGMWDNYFRRAQEHMREQHANLEPLDLGTIGYSGEESNYVPKALMDRAFAQDHLPLEFYRSYSHPHVDPSEYFYNNWKDLSSGLKLCSETDMYTSAIVERYILYTGDHDGVENVTSGGGDGTLRLVAKCSFSHWWLSPHCRVNISRCVPWISWCSKGCFMEAMMQRSAIWKMPLALAVADSLTSYTHIPNAYPSLFYGWWPDITHLALDPHAIYFPPYNELEWRRNLKRTNLEDSRVSKWAYSDLGNPLTDGFALPREVAGKMRLTPDDLKLLMRMHVERNLAESAAEDLACQWLNNNTQRWVADWIPLAGTCEEGQGMVDEDGNFLENRSGAKDCQWCEPGYMSMPFSKDGQGKTFICQKCPRGQMQGGKGEAFCVDCPAGEAAGERGLAACIRCEVGRFAEVKGLTQCTLCGAGFVTKHPGATDRGECVCPSGRYWDPDGQECVPCKLGMACEVGSDARGFLPEYAGQFPTVPLLTPSHWASAEDPLNVFRCENSLRCPGGRRPGQACALGLRRKGCALCEDGYHWDGASCSKCITKELSILLFPLLPILCIPLVIVLIYSLFGDTYERWGSWQNGIGAGMFILLNHYQIYSIQKGVDIGMPSSLRSIFASVAFTTDIMSISQPECAGFGGFESALALRALAPVFLILAYLFTWCAAWLISKTCYEPAYMEGNRTLNGFFSLIFTFFAGIASQSFTIFKCGENPNGKSSLMVDRSITCYEGEWMRFLAIGALSVLFWCVGFGMIFMWRIYTIGSRFHDQNVQMRWKFLFIRYRPDVHWWALVVVCKGISLNLSFILISNAVGQIFWVCFTIFCYVLMIYRFRPWRHLVLNDVDLWAHLAILFSTSCLLYWFARNTHQEGTAARDDQIMTVIGICVVLSVLPVSIPCMAWMIWRKRSGSHLEKRLAVSRDIQESFADLAAADAEAVEHFFNLLSDWDFWVVESASTVIEMELNMRRCRRGYSFNELEEITAGLDSRRSSREGRSKVSMLRAIVKASTDRTSMARRSLQSTATASSKWRQAVNASDRNSLPARRLQSAFFVRTIMV